MRNLLVDETGVHYTSNSPSYYEIYRCSRVKLLPEFIRKTIKNSSQDHIVFDFTQDGTKYSNEVKLSVSHVKVGKYIIAFRRLFQVVHRNDAPIDIFVDNKNLTQGVHLQTSNHFVEIQEGIINITERKVFANPMSFVNDIVGLYKMPDGSTRPVWITKKETVTNSPAKVKVETEPAPPPPITIDKDRPSVKDFVKKVVNDCKITEPAPVPMSAPAFKPTPVGTQEPIPVQIPVPMPEPTPEPVTDYIPVQIPTAQPVQRMQKAQVSTVPVNMTNGAVYTPPSTMPPIPTAQAKIEPLDEIIIVNKPEPIPEQKPDADFTHFSVRYWGGISYLILKIPDTCGQNLRNYDIIRAPAFLEDFAEFSDSYTVVFGMQFYAIRNTILNRVSESSSQIEPRFEDKRKRTIPVSILNGITVIEPK